VLSAESSTPKGCRSQPRVHDCNSASVFTDHRVYGVRLASLDLPFSLVTVRTYCGSRSAMVLDAGGLVHVVTRNARRKLRAVYHHVTRILIDVPVTRVQAGTVGLGPIHFVVLKQIISRDKVIRVWSLQRTRLPAS